SRSDSRSDEGRTIARRGKGRPAGKGICGSLRHRGRDLGNGSLHRVHLSRSQQGETMRLGLATAATALLLALAVPAGIRARQPQQRGGAVAARSAQEAAPIDLTGYWVAYVTENWRYRMVTPAKGEYRRIPSSPAALPLINAWDPAADERAGNQCKSYGA